jgi:bifunctional DNA-binding transcriptional regulator/antitoxin component of YhaV-PrlF toxin-antitoxin module
MTLLQLRDKGNLTLPSTLRKKYRYEKGEMFRLIDTGDGAFFIVPADSKVMQSADRVAKMVKEANVTLEELLETLEEERKQYYKEHYVED